MWTAAFGERPSMCAFWCSGFMLERSVYETKLLWVPTLQPANGVEPAFSKFGVCFLRSSQCRLFGANARPCTGAHGVKGDSLAFRVSAYADLLCKPDSKGH